MSVVEPQPNPETVELLLDTTWRVAAAETGRTEALDRKAATVATFASVVATLTATLGVPLVDQEPGWWTLIPFVTGLAALVGAVGFRCGLCVRRRMSASRSRICGASQPGSEILKRPEQVRGEMMRTLVGSIARGRSTNERKAESIRRSFSVLCVGLVLVAAQGATLAIKQVVA